MVCTNSRGNYEYFFRDDQVKRNIETFMKYFMYHTTLSIIFFSWMLEERKTLLQLAHHIFIYLYLFFARSPVTRKGNDEEDTTRWSFAHPIVYMCVWVVAARSCRIFSLFPWQQSAFFTQPWDFIPPAALRN